MKVFRSHVLVCAGTGCVASGALAVKKAPEQELATRSLQDEIQVVTTGCNGFCAAGPVMVVYPDGIFYQQLKAEDMPHLVEEHFLKGRPVQRLMYTEPVKKERVVGADRSRLDFDTQEEIDGEHVTASVNALVAGNHPVRSQWITDEDLDRQPELVRTLSGQPPRGAGRIPLLDIHGVDLQPCGGTHVAATGEIGRVVVTRVENKGRRNKRVYIALA